MIALNIEIAPSWHGRVDRSGGPNGCWPWTGGLMTNGYGQTRVKENGRWRGAGAHQVAYYLATGRWERKAEGRLVRHLCHRRRCCNPGHLRGGTVADNADDRQMRKLGISLISVDPYVLPVSGIANAVFAVRPEWPRTSPLAPYELPVAGIARDRHPAMQFGEAA